MYNSNRTVEQFKDKLNILGRTLKGRKADLSKTGILKLQYKVGNENHLGTTSCTYL